jgi:O-antigen ligase
MATIGVFVVVLFVTPLKEKVIDRLPFIGKAEQDSIEYRGRLSDTSWALVDQHPWFGDPFATLKMESLRQGQGIIDIVNGYLYTALFTGYVGLSLLCGVFALALLAGYRALRVFKVAGDGDGRATAAALVAAMVATTVYIATAGHGTTTLILCGLLASVGLAARRQATIPRATQHPLRAVSA